MSIQIVLQTRLNAPKVIYDSAGEGTGEGGAFVKGIVKPVIHVDVNGATLYQTGDFYPDYSPYILGAAAISLFALWVFFIKK